MDLIQKKRSAPVFRPGEGKRGLARDVRRQIAHAAGADSFQHRDPLYHVTESFHQTFDAVGRAHASRETEKTDDDGQKRQWQRADPVPEDAPARSFSEAGGDRNILRRFSEIAFQRGMLSGAVLRGTGKMMLFSCLKKTAGQLQPVNEHRRKLFDRKDLKQAVGNRSADTVIFDRGFTHSAVGLVVDALQSARRVVEDMQALITAGRDGERNGGDILWTMYPFLDDSRERLLLEQYHDMLGVLAGPEADERALLQSAIVRTHALIEKKTQMKEEFINKLRFISERAARALEEFTDPAFVHELLSDSTEQEKPSDSAKDEKKDMAGDGDDGEAPGEEGESEDGATDPEPDPADTATTDRLADA